MHLLTALAVIVSLFTSQAHGHPRATPDVDRQYQSDIEPTVTHHFEEGDTDEGGYRTEDTYHFHFGPKEDPEKDRGLKRISRDSQTLTDSRTKRGIEKGITSDDAVEVPPNLKVTFPEDPKTGTILKEDDDSIRSKKSTSPRENPHMTTVCIQVRSDHPSVVCGPQVDEEKDLRMNNGARSSFAGNDMYYRQQMFGRSSQGLGPATSPLRFYQDGSMKTVPIPANLPSAAKGPMGFSMMRNDDTPVDAHPPSTAAGQPGRGGPQAVPAGNIPPGPAGAPPVVIHKNVYPPSMPIPVGYQAMGGFSPYGISGLRLNCLSDYPWNNAGPVLRNAGLSEPQFVQIGDQIVAVQDRPSARMAQDAHMLESPALYLAPYNPYQGRSAHPDQMRASQFGYSGLEPLGGTAFIADDGQAYMIDDSQARAASDEQALRQFMDFQTFRATTAGSQNNDEMVAQKTKELQAANEKLIKLQTLVDKLEAKDDDSKKHKDQSDHAQEDIGEKKKSDSGTKKRQVKHNASF